MSHVRARALWLAIALAGCKGDKPPPAAQPVSPASTASGSALDWTRCEQALRTAPGLPPSKRAMAIIDACPVCGDWAPILGWQQAQQEGGPSHRALEDALGACKAWCDPSAKQRFLGLLDDARAKQTRGPWRHLGEVCREAVSAVPDARFMSAPYFALDRIAREVTTRPGGEQLLAPIAIPLPAVTVSGNGPALPVSPLSRPALLAGQITITQADASVGPVPIARLGARGVSVAGDPYPGRSVPLGELASAVAQLTGGPDGKPGGSTHDQVGVFAPEGLPAARLAEVIAAAGAEPLVLAVRARSGPPGWSMYGVVPVVLTAPATPASVTIAVTASPDAAVAAIKTADLTALKAAPVRLELAPDATVGSVATVLGVLAFREVPAAALVVTESPRRSR